MLSHASVYFKGSIGYALLQLEKTYADHLALAIGESVYSYRDLFAMSKNLACQLMRIKADYCLIISARNVTAYISLLAALFAGKAYVFLDANDSTIKLCQIISLVESNVLVFDNNYISLVDTLSDLLPRKLKAIRLNQRGQLMGDIGEQEDSSLDQCHVYVPPVDAYQYAYMMFTSGSTGSPKGVAISHKNLQNFICNINRRIKPSASDKFSHINELTFDFSVYEIFCCWFAGACLCVLPDNYFYGIDHYIKKHQITYWSSVPSVVQLLHQLKKLSAACFSSIRYSIFCGEVLTRDIAACWKRAAPNTIIDNLYGPTEATVAIMGYVWHEDENEVIPMGWPFPGQGFYLVNEAGQCVTAGEEGEIYLYGEQVAMQYWNNPDMTQSHFGYFNGRHVYKTGDLALWDENCGLVFKGRKDDQLKLHGYRVEKIEIENRIKTILQTQAIAIVALKDGVTNRVMSLVCFFAELAYSVDKVKDLCRKKLPYAMVPDVFVKLSRLPYNKNGKIDYRRLMHYVVARET